MFFSNFDKSFCKEISRIGEICCALLVKMDFGLLVSDGGCFWESRSGGGGVLNVLDLSSVFSVLFRFTPGNRNCK